MTIVPRGALLAPAVRLGILPRAAP